MSTSSSGRPRRPSTGRPTGNKRVAGQGRRGRDEQQRDSGFKGRSGDSGGASGAGGRAGGDRGDSGASRGRYGDRPSYGERRSGYEKRDQDTDRGSQQRRDDRGGDRGGFQRRDDRPSYGDRDRGGDRGGFQRRDDRGGDRGFQRRDDRPSYGDRDRGGDRGGFQRRDDRPSSGDRPRFGDRERGGFDRDRDRGGDRGGFQRRDDRPSSGDRGFQRRDDRPSYGDRDRGADRGFQRRDDRSGFERRDERPRFGDRDRGEGQAVSEVAKPGEATEGFDELSLPDDIDTSDLDADIRAELRTLVRMKAELVGGHLVMAGRLVDEDPEKAYAHARAAQQLAPRLAATREALGLAAYLSDRYSEALSELRAARRITGSNHQWAVMADCERGLGRPEKALEMAQAPEAKELDKATQVELRIVAAGARRDLGQPDAAVVLLQGADLTPAQPEPWTARLRYAYAEALIDADREEEAREWFARASE